MKNYIKKITLKKNWYIVDAENKILGRFASKLATILMGKHKSSYAPNIDIGDYIIVLNAKKISVTGKKYYNKIYYYHTGYVGNLKKTSFKDMIINSPKNIIKFAVKGMLPKGSLGRSMFNKLKVFNDDKHHHIAQNPKVLDI